jgi:hypothetical protein
MRRDRGFSPCGPPVVRRLLGLFLALVLLIGGPAEAQIRFMRNATVGAGAHFQTWSRDTQAGAQELSIPFFVILPLGKRLSLDVVSGSGFASLDTGGDHSLSGLTDTKIRASYILGDELALLNVGVNTPTGKTKLTGDERQVSSVLSQNAFGFRTASFGQGLDINVGLAMARKLGETVFGAGLGYLAKGEFTPSAEQKPYQPGSELSLTLGLDRKIMDDDGKLTLDVVYTTYGSDKKGGEEIFQSGAKILAQALLQVKKGTTDWRLFLIERTKGDSDYSSDDLTRTFTNGNQLQAGLSMLKQLSPALGLRIAADLKIYGDNGNNEGEATIMGLGPGIRYRFSPGRFIDLNLKYAQGKMDTRTVSGIEASCNLLFGM